MRTLKWGLIFLGVYFVISIVTFSLVALWVSYSKPTIEIHSQSPFIFSAERNTTYTLLLGTVNGDQPSPQIDAVNIAASWMNTQGRPSLLLERDSGRNATCHL